MRIPLLSNRDDETELRRFTEDYSKHKRIDEIPTRKLRHWAKATEKTEGQYISRYITPELWGDSIESLQTAVAILITYTPERSAAARARWPTTLTALRQEILKRKKPKKPTIR